MGGVEAILFNRRDLEKSRWDAVWSNVEAAAEAYSPENVTFHFPINDCDFVSDQFVRERLSETLSRVEQCGIAGTVVHSNRVRLIKDWFGASLDDERARVVDTLDNLASSVIKRSWLALENYPLMDNFSKEIDPLFCYPGDFAGVRGSAVGVLWDFCHYAITVSCTKAVQLGELDRSIYPHLCGCDYLDFVQIGELIRHWHFSAFRELPDLRKGTVTIEGVLPAQGSIDPEIYVEAFRLMERINPGAHVVFEILEDDYTRRVNGEQMAQWAATVLAPG